MPIFSFQSDEGSFSLLLDGLHFHIPLGILLKMTGNEGLTYYDSVPYNLTVTKKWKSFGLPLACRFQSLVLPLDRDFIWPVALRRIDIKKMSLR